MLQHFAFGSAVVTAALSAQAIVSPVGYEGAEGFTNTSLPFSHTSCRYLQIHGDLGSQPRVLRGLAFRADARFLGASARTVTAEMFAGDADIRVPSATFTLNYVGVRHRVIAQRSVSVPSRPIPTSAPVPFDAPLPFDVPYVHAGTNDFAWELIVTTNTDTNGYLSDHVPGSAAGGERQQAAYVMSGTGCATSMGAFEVRPEIETIGLSFWAGWWCRFGEPGSLATILLGATDPDLPIPGLCGSGRLRTDALLPLPPGQVDASGSFRTPRFVIPFTPVLVGASLFVQAVAPDASQPGLPLAVTNGLASRILDHAAPVHVTRVYVTDGTGPTGALQANSALIVRFQ